MPCLERYACYIVKRLRQAINKYAPPPPVLLCFLLSLFLHPFICFRNGAGFVLDAIDLRIEPGTLVGIVGPVGSSKSSLLMAVLREISPESPVGMGAAITPAVSAEVGAINSLLL